jgi:hypothetical protein
VNLTSRRLALVLLAAAASVAGPGVRGAEAEQARPEPVPDDAMAVAKREFEAVKAARGDSGLPLRNDLPRFSTPEMPVATGTGIPVVRPPTPPSARASNWLLDAMEKPDGKDARFRERRGSDAAASNAPAQTRLSDAAAGFTGTNGATPGEAGNPLARYLAGWMTPQDYTLLKPGISRSTPGAGIPTLTAGSVPSPGAASGSASEIGSTTLGLEAFPQRRGVTRAPRENPYLAGLGVTPVISFLNGSSSAAAVGIPRAPTGASGRTDASPGAGTTPSLLAPIPVLPPPPPSRIPDFAKPATDEKLFKPLKRF